MEYSLYVIELLLYLGIMKTYHSSLSSNEIYLRLASRTQNISKTFLDPIYEGWVTEKEFKIGLAANKTDFALLTRRLPFEPVIIGKMNESSSGGTDIHIHVRPRFYDVFLHVLVLIGIPTYEIIKHREFDSDFFRIYVIVLGTVFTLMCYIPYFLTRKKLIEKFKKNLEI